jgi:hypothetical protein
MRQMANLGPDRVVSEFIDEGTGDMECALSGLESDRGRRRITE